MHIVRYADPDTGRVEVGAAGGGRISGLGIATMAELLGLSRAEIQALVGSAGPGSRPLAEVIALPPVDGDTEVWAAGVTYIRSRDARVEESLLSTVYELVYQAERPEVFFKSVAWRVVTDDEPVGIRDDSTVDVPEPELALVVNAHAEIVGYVVANDMSSRSIEGENPIYLPQAKIYAGSCALSSGIRPAWELPERPQLTIEVEVQRAGEVVWRDHTSTGALRRSFAELIGCLFAAERFPAGVVLSTGTGVAPGLDFTLHSADVVAITVDEVGRLVNPVHSGSTPFGWLAQARADPRIRTTVRTTPWPTAEGSTR